MSRLTKILQIVQEEVEQADLGTRTLGMNQMRRELDRLAEKIRITVEKHLKCSNIAWAKEAFLRLIHIEKGNVARRKSSLVNLETRDKLTQVESQLQTPQKMMTLGLPAQLCLPLQLCKAIPLKYRNINCLLTRNDADGIVLFHAFQTLQRFKNEAFH